MPQQALIVQGGWKGHEPEQVADRFRHELKELGFEVEVSDTLASFDDADKLKGLSLIVPVWTMGTIAHEQSKNVREAVMGGVGLAGCHGGMCDAFREDADWSFMTGGQWVAHPGNATVEYEVVLGPEFGPINDGMKNFTLTSEQYYLHVDPAVRVYATTRFPAPGVDGPHVKNGQVDMPQVWTKFFGEGRVFYNALGHHADTFDVPEAMELMRRGFRWAAR